MITKFLPTKNILYYTLFFLAMIPGMSNAFSPNGDGIDDLWVIRNIALYPDNEQAVGNCRVNEIYSVKGYQNNWNENQLSKNTNLYILKANICYTQLLLATILI
jgi:hypothetical protein